MYIFPFYVFIVTKTLQLCNKPWWVVAVRYTEVTFDIKLLLVPQNDIRYREVSAISVLYKGAFLWDYDHDSIRSYEYVVSYVECHVGFYGVFYIDLYNTCCVMYYVFMLHGILCCMPCFILFGMLCKILCGTLCFLLCSIVCCKLCGLICCMLCYMLCCMLCGILCCMLCWFICCMLCYVLCLYNVWNLMRFCMLCGIVCCMLCCMLFGILYKMI